MLVEYLESIDQADLAAEIRAGDMTNAEKVNTFSRESKIKFIESQSRPGVSFNPADTMFKKLRWRKVRDHDHETGCFRGAAHSYCNLQFTQKKSKFVVLFHNSGGYDQHVLLKHLKRHDKHDRITALCRNQEKFQSVTWSRGDVKSQTLQFQDSLGFLVGSLDTVVGELRTAPGGSWENLPRTRDYVRRVLTERFGTVSEELVREALELVSAKAPYPYEWNDANRWECASMFDGELKETEMYKRLKDNKLHGVQNGGDARLEQLKKSKEDKVLEDTMHAKKVWETFGMRTFRDYHNLYLQLDVHHLSDAMENFRAMAMSDPDVGLDPLWFLGVPGLTYSSAMKYVERHLPDTMLEALTDEGMLSLVLATKRGGICQVSKRHVIANNKYMKNFNPLQVSKYILYLDMTNLYGAAMCEALPTGNYQWVDPDTIGHKTEEIKKVLSRYEDNGPKGFIFQVKKLFLKPELHDKFQDYPLAPATKEPPSIKQLSPFQQATFPPKTNPTKKLILDFEDKEHYACHWRTLKFLLDQGYEVDGVEQVISFDQSAWLKDYVQALTEKRKAAAKAGNKRLVDFYKLMINSLYGKLCENILGRPDIRVVARGKGFSKLTKMPNFKSSVDINDELVCAVMEKTEARVGTLTAAGMAVLDLSKLHMQKFHYEVMKEQFGTSSEAGQPTVTACYTDTDSMVYEIVYPDADKQVKGDAYADMYAIRQYFDMSGYKDLLPQFYDPTNHKVQGTMKDETTGNIIWEFIALRPKAYAYRLQSGKEDKKAKGAGREVVKTEMFMEDYLRVHNASVELFKNGENLSELLHKDATKDDKRKGLMAMESMQHKRTQMNIQSKQYNLGLDEQRDRVVLSAFDNKRWILDDGVNTLPFGHWRTRVMAD